MCSQNYSDDKLKSIEYLISVGTPLSKECIGTAIRVNDLRTIELLEHYNCPYPSVSFMKVWNLNIFELFSKRPKRRIKYLSCIPDNQIHLALTAQDKLVIMLKQCIKNHHNDDFKYLWHLYDNIPYAYALFLQTFEYKNMTLAKILLDCDRGLSITPCIYQLVIKSGIDLTYLNQIRALDKDPVSSHMYLDVAKSNVLLLEWFIENNYLELEQSSLLLNCAPHICSWLVDYGLNISEDFLKLISRRCISSLETSARYSAQDTSLNSEHRWFTIRWLLKRGCCFHPVIGELLIISGNEKWCEWYADEWGQFTERCYNFAVTSGSIKLLNLIFKTGIKLVISNMEDLTLRLIKRGSTTCIKWFEDKGIVFNICSKQIVKTLNANCNADILQGASSHLIDFPSIPTETKKLF